MICANCGYMMTAFDTECARCHAKPGQIAPPQQPTAAVPPLPAQMTTTASAKCPFCAEDIQPNAQKCKHCNEWLTPQSQRTLAPVHPHSSVTQQAAALNGQSYLNQSRTESETITYVAKLHWIVFVKPGIGGFFLFLLAMSSFAGKAVGMGFFFILCAGLVIANIVMRFLSTEYAVTTRRILSKEGSFSRRSNELMLTKVESLRVEQDVMGRMFNYGTIAVIGTGGSKELFPQVADPLELRKQVQNRL